MSELEIQNSILEYLNLRGDCFAWRNNSIGVFDPVKKIYRRSGGFAIKGVSDILGVMRDGRFLAIEVKNTGKEKTVSKEQLVFITKMIKMKAIAIVATNIETVKEQLEKHGYALP